MNKKLEIWKDIPHFNGVYQISNFGKLKSFKSNSKGMVLSNKNKNGDYLSVVLKHGDNVRYARIHILVAELFIGNNHNNKQIHHKDGNKQNNNVSNLEYLTSKEHCRITIKENPNVIKNMVKHNKDRARPVLQYDFNNNLLAEYKNVAIASKLTNVCYRNISQVASKEEYKKGKTRKQAGGFIWKWKY